MLHGTRDTSATFQFFVESLEGDWQVVAPDWRGHGHSEWVPRGYWFHEFLGDLDALIAQLFPGRPVPLIGHSLGGNIAGIYAGLRPERISHLISLDGFGPLVNRLPVDIAEMLRGYLDGLAHEPRRNSYATLEEVKARLRKANPRLDERKADFLARNSARRSEDGQYSWLYDPTHRFSLPSLHSMEEWGRVWERITAPALWISSQDARPHAPFGMAGEIERRAAHMPSVRRIELPDTGHNLHHDAPERVAELIQAFIGDPEGALGG